METVGQVYMAASGAPERTEKHAQNVADLALRMLESVKKLDTSSDSKIEIRIGCSSLSF